MTKNNLEPGVPRLGTIFDGNPNTPETRSTIELTKQGIKLSVTWSTDATNVYARWFKPRNYFQDDPEDATYIYEVPSKLSFRDSKGTIQLIGCRNAGWHEDISHGFGAGTILARYAILGVSEEPDYQKVHGLSSDIVGLRSWVGIESVKRTITYGPEKNTAVVNLDASESIPIPSKEHIRLVPGWDLSDEGDVTRLEDRLRVQTMHDGPVTWGEHLEDHGKIRDLLNISLWKSHGLKISKVINEDHREEIGQGGAKAYWKEVRATVSNLSSSDKHPFHLIKYSDIGPEGLARWIDLSTDFSRAINPAVSMHRLKGVDAEVQLAQISISLEALGYLIFMRDDSLSESEARDKRFKDRLVRIGDDIGSVLPFDVDNWAQGTANAYNGVKHANRALPDFLDMVNRTRESCLAFRIWIALELGVDAEQLKKRLEWEPQARPYELA